MLLNMDIPYTYELILNHSKALKCLDYVFKGWYLVKLGRLPKKTKEMISIPEKFHLRFLSSLWFCSVWFWLTTLISLNFCPYEIDLKMFSELRSINYYAHIDYYLLLLKKFESEQDTCSCYLWYRIILLRNSFRFSFKKPFVTRLWSSISRQPWRTYTG